MANGLWRVQIDQARFAQNVRDNLARAQRESKTESQKLAAKFEQHLRRNVPTDSGDLASTIRVTAVADGFIISIGDDAHPYAVPLEFGHVLNGTHVPGKHFWLPLAKIYNKRWRAAMRRAMKRAFKNFK